MRSRRRTTAFAAATLLISMAASVLLLHRVDEIRPRANIEDVLYISSPKMVKRASLGFEGLMACIYWKPHGAIFRPPAFLAFPFLQRTRAPA